MHAKREKAAIQIQRVFRRKLKTKKELLAEEMKKAGAFNTQLTEEDLKIIDQRKKELKNLRDRFKDKKVDTFYSAIDKERRSELADKVVAKKRIYIHSEMLKKDLVKIDDMFCDEFSEYMTKYGKLEHGRQ